MLCTSDVRLTEPPRRIGATGHHLSLRLEQHGVALRAVAFGGGDWEDDLNEAAGPLSVAFKPIINSFRGRVTVEMQLADWRTDDSTRSSLQSGIGRHASRRPGVGMLFTVFEPCLARYRVN